MYVIPVDGVRMRFTANQKKGYHVQVTARSERDLTPEGIVQKVADSSGSKYTAGVSSANASNPAPVVSSKPAFTPTRSNRGAGGFNPLASSRTYSNTPKDDQVDEDGWGQDAPQVTRTQLEKVQSSYQPTKVNMRELTTQTPEVSKFNSSHQNEPLEGRDVVKGGYQPVGKVDIAALRRQAQGADKFQDDRPTVVKGSYEPVGKVDIAAIRARAQKPSEEIGVPAKQDSSAFPSGQIFRSGHDADQAERSAPLSSSERLTSLPKPKTGKGFGSGASAFTGTKAPIPGGLGQAPQTSAKGPPVGVGRTFADQGGKTPAQLWAERKARERGGSELDEKKIQSRAVPPSSAIAEQKSGGGEWKSNYEGKTWGPVQTTRTGQSQGSINQQHTGEEDQQNGSSPLAGGVSAIRDRFKDASPMGGPYSGGNLPSTSPPPLDTSSKPNSGHAIPVPGLPNRPPQLNQREEEEEEEQREVPSLPTPPRQPPRSPTPPTPPALDHGSPIRIARPVGRGHELEINDAHEEQFSPPPVMPTRSLAQVVPQEDDLTEEPADRGLAHRASEAAAAAAPPGAGAAGSTNLKGNQSGRRALVQYDYEKAEDNELELKEGEHVINIEMVDEDWWMGQNKHGESGLFPSNYVELVEEHDDSESHDDHQPRSSEASRQGATATATALYDYDAAESNELSFPENAKITDVVRTQSMICLCEPTDLHDRNFPTKTGGLESIKVNRAFFLPTTFAWMSDRVMYARIPYAVCIACFYFSDLPTHMINIDWRGCYLKPTKSQI